MAIANHIMLKLQASYRQSFDVFYAIVSTTVWRSPKELAEIWIDQVTPEAWKSLEEQPSDSVDVRRSKESVRNGLLSSVSMVLANIWSNPTFIQRLSTRVLIRNILAHDLPSHDQDRVIAAELMTTLRLWKSLQNTLTTHGIVSGDHPLLEMPLFEIDQNGGRSCMIKVKGPIKPIEALREITIIHGSNIHQELRSGIVESREENTCLIIFPEHVLTRHEALIDPKNQAQALRNSLINGFDGIPVFKKWGHGNKPSKIEPKWVLRPSPV
jgi:hypothetical protein